MCNYEGEKSHSLLFTRLRTRKAGDVIQFEYKGLMGLNLSLRAKENEMMCPN